MTEVEQFEKILLSENTKAIQVYESELKFRIEQTKKILNRIAENYSFDSLEQMPNDVDGWILKIFFARNRKAKEQFDWQPFGINEINLPDDLKKLRVDLNEWAGWTYKEATAYLTKEQSGRFIDNPELIAKEILKFAESQRVYISEPEQIERYKHSLNMVRAIEFERDKAGLDFSKDTVRTNLLRGLLQRNPFVIFLGYPENRFTINQNYILTGIKL